MPSRVIDYSPLSTPVSAAEIAAYRQAARAAGRSWSTVNVMQIVLVAIVAGGIAVFVLPTFVFGAFALLLEGGGASIMGGVMLLVTLGMLGGAVWLIVRTARGGGSATWARRVRMDRFARANGMRYSPADPSPRYPGAIFSLGSSRMATDHFTTVEGRFVDFGNYRYTTGSGKNRSTRHWGFLAVELDRRLPHMMLDSKANNGMFGTNLPATFRRDQVLSLEGDFDRYFTLYCPRQYERDALYVFTPDLMALLIDEAAPFDVEVVDDWMFVYSSRPFPPGDASAYARLLRIVDTVGSKAVRQTDRYHDERTMQPFAADIVAPQGQRLRRGVPVVAIVVGAVVVGYWVLSTFGGMLLGFLG